MHRGLLRHRASPAMALALIALFALVGCGGEPGKEAVKTVTVTETVPSESPDEGIREDEPSTTANDAADVRVTKVGFAQSGESVDYGLALRNTSATEDALEVSVSINFMTRRGGRILSSESATVNVIPAGKTFYLGGGSYLEQRASAGWMEATATVARSLPHQYPLPKVVDVRATPQEYGGYDIRGEVRNTLNAPLSQLAQISVVLFDEGGRIVGGSFTYLDSDLPPGGRAGFNTSISSKPPVASVRASMDNEVAE